LAFHYTTAVRRGESPDVVGAVLDVADRRLPPAILEQLQDAFNTPTGVAAVLMDRSDAAELCISIGALRSASRLNERRPAPKFPILIVAHGRVNLYHTTVDLVRWVRGGQA